LGTGFGKPRIYVEFGAELHVVALAAEITKEGFSPGGVTTGVTEFHGVEEETKN
jgi:hypothetical protein